ncbi:MAG: superoxide dismutase, Fe-Mn family [Candidatus Dependentiae bacterium]|nr:superoxide dismutase, Fe-Mn family [Candidatus Dependentiae bacterium]
MGSTTSKLPAYDVREELKPENLFDISAEQIDDHWNLYKGYVKQVNTLNEELVKLRDAGEVGGLVYADRRRRYGFEYNGMVLHEYYFGNLKNNQNDLETGDLLTAMTRSFGSYNTWKKDFEAAAKSRAIGWAILYADTTTGALTNHFIAEHGNGNVAGFSPVLVLDVWEHAYMVDHLASGRGDYIAAFMKNIDWDKAQERYEAVKAGKITPRF